LILFNIFLIGIFIWKSQQLALNRRHLHNLTEIEDENQGTITQSL
jgi:hypothetical protein